MASLAQQIIQFIMLKTKGKNLFRKDLARKNPNSIFKILPNTVTLAGLCVALSAIRSALNGDFAMATGLVILAAFMDGIDGRLARFLNSVSDFGAQLDSLADFTNFGVVPVVVLYIWINEVSDIKGFDWAMVLFFATCGAIRLARFNVELQKEVTNPIIEKYFFKGMPIPCGASLALLPMVLYYEFGDGFYSNPELIIFYVFTLGVLMASTVPTLSVKKIPILNEYVYPTLLLIALVIAGLVARPWLTLAAIGIFYITTIPITIIAFLKIQFGKKTRTISKSKSI